MAAFVLPGTIYTQKVQLTIHLSGQDKCEVLVSRSVYIAARNGARIAQEEICMAAKKELNRLGMSCGWVSWYDGLISKADNNPNEVTTPPLFDQSPFQKNNAPRRRRMQEEVVCESIPLRPIS